jgi:hypothetical protein
MSRYLIQNSAGMFYSGNFVPEIQYVSRKGDPTVADPRPMLQPLFESGNVSSAIKYETAADVASILNHPDLVDAEAFADCVVMECEFDQTKPAAVRPA